jgi:5-oxoprolinase (ATP-hydrolysing)
MQGSVKYQINYHAENNIPLQKGEVILVNHPACGGSHLPDLTIITPVCIKLFINIYKIIDLQGFQ